MLLGTLFAKLLPKSWTVCSDLTSGPKHLISLVYKLIGSSSVKAHKSP